MSEGTLRLVVKRAAGVLNRDTFGKSDPYCLVFHPNGNQILKTITIDDTLNPEWPEASSTATCKVNEHSPSAAAVFKFQLFDDDPGSDEFLGETILSVTDIVRQPNSERALTLMPRPNEPDTKFTKRMES